MDGQPLLDPLMKAEWLKPEKKSDLGSRFKTTYKIDPGSTNLSFNLKGDSPDSPRPTEDTILREEDKGVSLALKPLLTRRSRPRVGRRGRAFDANSCLPRVGARLFHFASQWLKTSSDSWVNSIITKGYALELTTTPPNKFVLNRQDPHVLPLISEFLLKGALEPVQISQRGFGIYSRIFAVPKKGGSWRLVIDLTYLNTYIVRKRFRMETIRSVLSLLEEGYNQYERCLSSHTNCQISQEISKVGGAGKPRDSSLSVHMPPFRAILCTQSLYESDCCSGCPSSSSGSEPHPVPRRLADPSPLGRSFEISSSADHRSPSRSWLSAQLSEVSPLSNFTREVSGIPDRFSGDEVVSIRRQALQAEFGGLPIPGSVRQPPIVFLSEQTGRYEILSYDGRVSPTNVLSGRPFGVTACSTLPGIPESSGGLPEQEELQPSRMEPQPQDFSPVGRKIWPARDECHGHKSKPEGSYLLLHLSQGPPRSSGRPFISVEQQISLCLPSVSPHTTDAAEDQGGTCHSPCSTPVLAQEGLVPTRVEAFERLSLGAPSSFGFASSRRPLSSSIAQVETHGLAAERVMLSAQGFSEEVINLLAASRKPSTLKVYSRVMKLFSSWCMLHNVVSPSLSQVLEFLKDGFDKGLKPNTLRVQFSAINNFYQGSFSNSALVSRFFKAIANLRPSVTPPVPHWDLPSVLHTLEVYGSKQGQAGFQGLFGTLDQRSNCFVLLYPW
ncbi:uncharacterized protein LOC130323316 [Hyla sarda]|uniref:uncharacterized protein LOC130323316 n=1 Tax=Hyla sarda TaxID=327740 RepID=UPI0024C369F7|nr:uncharacterized protein LOC130323316 [Hyla sarda]